MARITFIESGGTAHTVEVESGNNLMQGAVFNNIQGIEAECGGACVCATCHIHIDESWANKLPPAEEVEMLTLEETENPNRYSRLACQIKVDDSLEGLTVHIPENQGW